MCSRWSALPGRGPALVAARPREDCTGGTAAVRGSPTGAPIAADDAGREEADCAGPAVAGEGNEGGSKIPGAGRDGGAGGAGGRVSWSRSEESVRGGVL